VRALIVVALIACGPKASRPAYDTAKLARELHLDLTELGAIAKRHRGDCPALIAALEPHVARMRAHAREVARVQQDPELAKRLRRDVMAYDSEHRGLADTIGDDLGASYRTCPDNKQLLHLIDRIPELR
jgi:hypothetical protein